MTPHMVSAIIIMSLVSDIIKDISLRKKNISCCGKGGLLKNLESLGFRHSGGKTEGHRVFTHKRLSELTDSRFTTYSIDCGHKPNKEMKLPYVVKTLSLLKKYKSELEAISKE